MSFSKLKKDQEKDQLKNRLNKLQKRKQSINRPPDNGDAAPFRQHPKEFINNYKFKPNLKHDKIDVNQRIVIENIREKMDIYNDKFRDRLQNGKIKGSKLLLTEDVPQISKMKFNMNYDYTKNIDKQMSEIDRAVEEKYNYNSVLEQLKKDNVNINEAEYHPMISEMPFPEHFAQSLRKENAMLKEK